MLEIKKKKSLKLLKYCVSEAKICEEGPCLNGGICVGIEMMTSFVYVQTILQGKNANVIINNNFIPNYKYYT